MGKRTSLLPVLIILATASSSQQQRQGSADAGNRTAVNGTIRIGYSFSELTPPYRVAAISLAIEQAQADGLLPGYNFR
jgi:hypothetical protein